MDSPPNPIDPIEETHRASEYAAIEAYFRHSGTDAEPKLSLLKRLTRWSYFEPFPYFVAGLWQYHPGRDDWGRGDLVFANVPGVRVGYKRDTPARILVVEVAHLDYTRTGSTVSVRRTKHKKKALERLITSVDVWAAANPGDTVFGATIHNAGHGIDDLVINHTIGDGVDLTLRPIVSSHRHMSFGDMDMKEWLERLPGSVPLSLGERTRRDVVRSKVNEVLAGTTQGGEEQLVSDLLSSLSLGPFPYIVDAEWEYQAGMSNLGRGDVVFASGPDPSEPHLLVLVIEAKFFRPEEGQGRKRTEARRKVETQVQASMDAWQRLYPTHRVIGAAFISEHPFFTFHIPENSGAPDNVIELLRSIEKPEGSLQPPASIMITNKRDKRPDATRVPAIPIPAPWTAMGPSLRAASPASGSVSTAGAGTPEMVSGVVVEPRASPPRLSFEEVSAWYRFAQSHRTIVILDLSIAVPAVVLYHNSNGLLIESPRPGPLLDTLHALNDPLAPYPYHIGTSGSEMDSLSAVCDDLPGIPRSRSHRRDQQSVTQGWQLIQGLADKERLPYIIILQHETDIVIYARTCAAYHACPPDNIDHHTDQDNNPLLLSGVPATVSQAWTQYPGLFRMRSEEWYDMCSGDRYGDLAHCWQAFVSRVGGGEDARVDILIYSASQGEEWWGGGQLQK